METIVQALHKALTAKANCDKTGNLEWRDHWEERIEQLMGTAPSGSGLDNGTTLDRWNSHQLKFKTSYHHMKNEFYAGWTDHTLTIQPGWEGPEITRCTGPDNNGVKDYICDIFYEWLTDENVPDYPWTPTTAEETK